MAAVGEPEAMAAPGVHSIQALLVFVEDRASVILLQVPAVGAVEAPCVCSVKMLQQKKTAPYLSGKFLIVS